MLFTVTSKAFPWDFYFFKLTQPLAYFYCSVAVHLAQWFWLFDKMEPSRPEIDVKWDSNFQNSFFFIWASHPILALKLAKSVNISKKKFLLLFDSGIIKRKIYCWVPIHWKKVKKSPKKSSMPKTFAFNIKSQKTLFFLSIICW